MANKNVIWSPLAEEDFNHILAYLYEQWGNEVALRFIDTIEQVIFQIIKYPDLFPLINKDIGVHKCVITKQNTLFYKLDDKNIYLLRIFDTRQNPDTLQF